MRRFAVGQPLMLLCAAWLGGCGPSMNAFVEKPWFNRGAATAERSPDNPLRQRGGARPTANEPSEKLASTENTTTDESQAAAEKLAKFDQETLDLVEAELQQSPAEERVQFYQDVSNLQPAMVRQIIRMRRIVRQVGQDAPSRQADAEHSVDSTSRERAARFASDPIQQVAAAEAAVELTDHHPSGNQSDPSRTILGRDPARDPGLGGADPWDRAETASPAFRSAGGWTDDPSVRSSQMPFNRIPHRPDAREPAGNSPGHVTAYPPPRRPARPNQINPVQLDSASFGSASSEGNNTLEPPPGGAQSPVGNSPSSIPAPPNAPYAQQNARIPGDYNPLAPPVQKYAATGDPFSSSNSPPVRSASSDPNQQLPGVANGFDPEAAFGPLPGGNNPSAVPGGSPANSTWKAELPRVISQMEAEVRQLRYADQATPEEKNAYVQKHVYLRLLYLMADEEERALTAIPNVPAPDQEFWQQTLWAMANYFDTQSMPDSDYRATQTIAQLRTAIQKLQENARLELRNVAFCHKIASFGSFERFTRDEFGPGQPVLVYAEVANFKSKPTADGQYLTQLKSTIEIHRLGPSGEVVETFDFEPTEDICRNHRRDYFHSYEFTIPQRISLGPHVMTLSVEDQLSRKVATYRLNFMVK